MYENRKIITTVLRDRFSFPKVNYGMQTIHSNIGFCEWCSKKVIGLKKYQSLVINSFLRMVLPISMKPISRLITTISAHTLCLLFSWWQIEELYLAYSQGLQRRVGEDLTVISSRQSYSTGVACKTVIQHRGWLEDELHATLKKFPLRKPHSLVKSTTPVHLISASLVSCSSWMSSGIKKPRGDKKAPSSLEWSS